MLPQAQARGCAKVPPRREPGFDRGHRRRYPPAMPSASPLHLLLAAGPDAAGMGALLKQAQAQAAAGRDVRVLLSAGGLRWAQADRRRALPPAADLAVCSQDARAAGWSAETTPAGVRWSSVATWLAEIDGADEPLWIGLP